MHPYGGAEAQVVKWIRWFCHQHMSTWIQINSVKDTDWSQWVEKARYTLKMQSVRLRADCVSVIFIISSVHIYVHLTFCNSNGCQKKRAEKMAFSVIFQSHVVVFRHDFFPPFCSLLSHEFESLPMSLVVSFHFFTLLNVSVHISCFRNSEYDNKCWAHDYKYQKV